MSPFRCSNTVQRAAALSWMFFLAVLLLSPPTAFASIVDTGDVLESGGNLDIGTTAYGKREITDETVSYVATHLGNTAGVRGELFLTNTQYTNSNELVVGVLGEGLLNLVRDNNALVNSLTAGQSAGANGSVIIGPSTLDLGTAGTAIIGDAGTGSLTLNGAQYSVGIPIAKLNANHLVLGAQASGVGSLTPSCNSNLHLGGEAPVLVIADSGQANVSMSNIDDGFACETPSLALQGLTPNVGLTFVARKPGSTGALNLTGRVFFYGGDMMRIGLDDQDQPGGVGTVNVSPILYSTAALQPNVSAKLTKIGPQGKLQLNSAVDVLRFNGIGASFTGDIENRGIFGGSIRTRVTGNVINHAKLAAVADGFNAPCCIVEHGPTITGDFMQTVTGEQAVTVLLGAFQTDVLGTLTVNGSAHYDGKINVLFQDGSRLVAGDQFHVLSVLSGNATYEPTFTVNFDASGLNPALTPVADISPTGIIVRIVPNSTQNADLAIGMTDSPDSVLQGQTVSYAISVTNNGPSPATDVTVTGSLPACVLGNIVPGATATCTRTAIATTAGTLIQTMTVSGNEADPNTANNSASVSTTVYPAADLALTMTDSPDPVKKGTKLVYTLTVTNNGPSSAANVSLSDTLPPNVVFVGLTKTQGTCSGTATITCALGTLNSGATATVKIIIKPKTVGTITNSASANASVGDPNTINNNATVTTLVKR